LRRLEDALSRDWETYAQTRKSDPGIAAKLLEILASSQASTVADIGAGTGSYSLILAE